MTTDTIFLYPKRLVLKYYIGKYKLEYECFLTDFFDDWTDFFFKLKKKENQI